jgi:voltage-gated potassium channel
MSDPVEQDRLVRLASIPLFADLPTDAVKDLLDRVTEFEVERGHVLVQPNQPGMGLFVIEAGRVIVELPERTIELGPGEFFGDLALLDKDAVHVGRVCAATPLKCLALRRDDFEKLLESQPKIAISMLKVLARRMAAAARPPSG